MGISFSDTWTNWFGDQKSINCLLLGLKGSGKLTILFKMKLGDYYPSIPEIDYQVGNIKISAFHVGGQYNINKPTWRQYLNNKQVIIYIIDSADVNSIDESCDELHKILKEDKLKNAVLLVYANKPDLPNAITPDEIKNRLGLDEMKNRVWHVEGLCGITAEGLCEGFDWINEQLLFWFI